MGNTVECMNIRLNQAGEGLVGIEAVLIKHCVQMTKITCSGTLRYD